ncbi:MAG: GNAT family N-acetyltransferase [Lachnospiraceae bacterium]|nr:GNAT family N-acetyltransferase [Lachnospiraceae bacterium]
MSVNQWKVCKLNHIQEKLLKEQSLRWLWRECFGDPLEYENYYFQNVYLGNTVYMLEYEAGHREEHSLKVLVQDGMKKECFAEGDVCGMLHLNPYFCKVNGVEVLLHYVVGVATAKEARRQGVMRTLLSNALSGLYKAGEPFTYLMPADVRYYEPFDFVPICEKEEWKMSAEEIPSSIAENDVIYTDYNELKAMFEEDLDCLLSYVDYSLSDNYSGFVSHGREYFDLLAREKECENGAVIFCFDQAVGIENLIGFFAYGREGEAVFVEQNVLFKTAEWNLTGKEENPHVLAERERTEEIMQGYFGNAAVFQNDREQKNGLQECIREIRCIASYPYMVRVVHVQSFLKLFADCFAEFAENGTRLYVEDPLLFDAVEKCQENNKETLSYTEGVYTFRKKEDTVIVCRQEISQMEYDVKMTVSELVCYVFGKKGKKLFFSELV